MIRRLLRIGLWLGLAGGIALAVIKLRSRAPAAVAPGPAPPTELWVEPRDGGCPPSHPVKAKLSSKIFHLPGMANYDRTIPDRCYASASAAETDGLRQAKR